MASYIIEGKGSKNFVHTKRLMHEDETAWNGLLEKITTATIDYLNTQIQAGCQAVQIFDSWVGCLTPDDYRRFVFPHTKRLIASLKPGTPVISFGTQTNGLLPLLVEAGGDVMGVDWRIELDEAWSILGPNMAIMGNLDPTILLSTKAEIERQAKRILAQAGGRPGHIFNLGHGVLPETPLENVLHLIDVVKKHDRNLNRPSS
jgi:uroporphyrinogen decarboxylase